MSAMLDMTTDDNRQYLVIIGSQMAVLDARDLASAVESGYYSGETIDSVWYYGGWRADDPAVVPTMRLATLRYELVGKSTDDQGYTDYTFHQVVIYDRAGQEIGRADYRIDARA